MAISNPLNGIRKGGTVGKPLPGVQVSGVHNFRLQYLKCFTVDQPYADDA